MDSDDRARVDGMQGRPVDGGIHLQPEEVLGKLDVRVPRLGLGSPAEPTAP